jgi:hypothetical protein
MMVVNSASARFGSLVEDALARLTDERFQIALQIVVSSIDPRSLDRLQTHLDKFPDNSPKKNAVDIARIVGQLASVTPQIVALDLDRSTPLRILGIGRATTSVLFSAKCFGHSAVLAGRLNFVTNLLLELYEMSSEVSQAPSELPDGSFDMIISYGGPNLSTKHAWAAFTLPLASKLTENGRIFVALPKEANAKKNYYPDLVLAKLAHMGARVSSKNGFVLLDHAAIKRLESGTVQPGAGDRPRQGPGNSEADVPAMTPDAERQTAVVEIKPNWRRAALIGSFVILIGLLVATWAGH